MFYQKNNTTENQKIVYVFIDASNIWEIQKAKGKLFDYGKLKIFLKKKFNADLIQVFYYTCYPADGTRDYDLTGKHKFYTFLKKGLNFIVRKKKLKRITIITDEGQSIEEKGNMDVEITIDALHHIKNIILRSSLLEILISWLWCPILEGLAKKFIFFLPRITFQRN